LLQTGASCRKLLIVDRRLGFAGGMNIGDRQLAEGPSPPEPRTGGALRGPGRRLRALYARTAGRPQPAAAAARRRGGPVFALSL